mmetsp:Transcript_25120/g.59893  ORF Transcript_25120/g.59893 Transcript_25120/m.59893 type:complete len:235 (-) Transcript_25120:951-1655(-)
MTGLPVFFCTGAFDRSMDLLMRSSCCFFCAAIFSARTLARRSFSRSFSALSTSSWGIFSMADRCSSSLASTLASIMSVPRDGSASNPHRSYTSVTRLLSAARSASVSCSSLCPLRGLARSRSAAALASSPEIAFFKFSIWEVSCSVSSSIFALVTCSFCFNSSSCSSVSCEFWMRKRLRSSKAAKMSRSCCGRVRYMGTSNACPPSGSQRWSSESSLARSFDRSFFASSNSASF